MIGETVYLGSLGHQKLGRNVPATSRGQAADVPDGNVIYTSAEESIAERQQKGKAALGEFESVGATLD